MTVHRGLPPSRPLGLERVLNDVKDIIVYVRTHGDNALKELTKRFDGICIERIALDEGSLKDCSKDLDQTIIKAIDTVYEVLMEINKSSLPKDVVLDINGVKMGYLWRSIESVGIYVPGGRKSYPSTLLMAGIPAKVAKVKRIYVASPPASGRCVNPAVAYVAQLLEVEEVYNVGGAQAIAALAYGTESVKRVDKIVGPGNIYVQAAKFLVQEVVSIDGIEGPTELVVIADNSSDPRQIALDMMAQAEHGYGTFIVLITNSENVASRVSELLEKDTEHDYYVVTVKSIDDALDVANMLAPEHLSLHISDPEKYLGKVVNVGAVSLGSVPPAIIDYVGPNHILPTNSWARSKGALSVYDFLKPVSVVFSCTNIDQNVLEAVKTLAKYEGFEVHSKSIGVRFGNVS